MDKRTYIKPLCETYHVFTKGNFMDEVFSVFNEETTIVGGKEFLFEDDEEQVSSRRSNLWDD